MMLSSLVSAVSDSRFARRMTNLVTDDDGAAAVEYAVMLALILVVSITVITGIGTKVHDSFQKTSDALQTALGSAA